MQTVCEGFRYSSLGPLASASRLQLAPQPGPPAVLSGPLRQLKGGRGRGSRRRWSHSSLALRAPAPAPPPEARHYFGWCRPRPHLQVSPVSPGSWRGPAASLGLHLGLGPPTSLQPCRAAQCHMPTRPPPSTNLPTRAAWVSSASEKVWHRHHPLASHPHLLKFWADLPMVLASTPLRA